MQLSCLHEQKSSRWDQDIKYVEFYLYITVCVYSTYRYLQQLLTYPHIICDEIEVKSHLNGVENVTCTNKNLKDYKAKREWVFRLFSNFSIFSSSLLLILRFLSLSLIFFARRAFVHTTIFFTSDLLRRYLIPLEESNNFIQF